VTDLLIETPTLDDPTIVDEEDDIKRRLACANGRLVDGDRRLHRRGVL
jgi:hypothetical protein